MDRRCINQGCTKPTKNTASLYCSVRCKYQAAKRRAMERKIEKEGN